MGKNLGGRGKKSIVSKKAYWVSDKVGDAMKVIAEKYESLMETDPNQAEKLLDDVETLLLKISKKHG